ncbi:MAG: GGDEF domain-containing protein [Actinomycetota bacterium]|nr:GGDEF domain-containing protein [Actinomycetota bacterium]
MTPTLKQRLGLAPVQLTSPERQWLLAARVGSALFAVEASLVLGATAVTGGVTGDTMLLIAVICGYGLAFAFLLIYERLGVIGAHVLALAGNASITLLVVDSELGASYRILYVWPAIYVAFFMRRRQAAFQVAAIASSSGCALAATLPTAQAIELWLVSSGILAGAAMFTSLLRDYLIKLLENAHKHRAALDAFFLHAPSGFGFLDCDLRHVRVNQALAEIMDLECHQIEGHLLGDVAPINAHVLEPLARHAIDSGEPVLGIEIENPDGRFHLVSYYPMPGATGLAGVGTAVTDVTHLKDVERRLEETNGRLTVLATTDELTQLPNRRMLDEQLDLALARARRGGLAVAVLNIDLDRFKDVNDTLGHAIGDDVLVEVAVRLRAGARDTDIVARIGGDEFVIVLADLDVQEAPELAETVADRVRGLLTEQLAVGPVELSVDASIGVSIYPVDSRDARGLLAAADAAMYAGKSSAMRVA